MKFKKAPYEVPENKKIKVICDSDAYCEGDDQYAIAHLLKTEKVQLRYASFGFQNRRQRFNAAKLR